MSLLETPPVVLTNISVVDHHGSENAGSSNVVSATLLTTAIVNGPGPELITTPFSRSIGRLQMVGHNSLRTDGWPLGAANVTV